MNRIAELGAVSSVWAAQQTRPQIRTPQSDDATTPGIDPTQRTVQVPEVETAASAGLPEGVESPVLTEQAGRELVDKLNDSVSHQDLAFSVDQDTGSTVITVTSRNTGEVVRQIPSEEALNMMQELRGQSSASVESARIFDQLA